MSRQRATCTSCGSTFWRDPAESWKHLCLSCWRESKAKADRQADNLRIQLNRALVENAVLQRKLARLETSTGIPDDVLARLIRLSHPDKHQGSKTATEVTKWLLSQRKEARR